MEYYIEYIIFQEFVIDFILLYFTNTLLKKKIIYGRVIFGALVGVVYTTFVYLIPREFLNYFIVKFMVSVFMITIAISPFGLLGYIKSIICFYILSLLTFGITIFSYFIFKSRLTIILIIASLFCVYLIIKIFFYEIKKNIDDAEYMREVKVYLNGSSASFRGYIDTGNELRELMLNKPVIVAKKDSLNSLFDIKTFENISNAYKNGTDAIMNFMLENLDNYNFRVIKYGTISSEMQYMLCVVPDKVLIKTGDKCIIVDCVIGIYNNALNDEDKYQALLFKELLKWEGEKLDANEYF